MDMEITSRKSVDVRSSVADDSDTEVDWMQQPIRREIPNSH